MPELVAVEFNPFKAAGTPDDFRARYSGAAEKAGKALGVDPNVLLGQWGLETGWGKSVIPGTNNLGNIKDFSGSGVGATDNMTGSRDKYRQYDTPEAFADDYVGLIQRKYPNAVGAKDAQSFATALKAGGYAEDPGYVGKVAQASKLAAPKGLIQRGVEAIIPSAQAETKQPELVPVDFDPFAKKGASVPAPKADESIGDRVIRAVGGVLGPTQVIGDLLTNGQFSKDTAAGLVRGAGSIGATLVRPFESKQENADRRASMDSALQSMGADPNSYAYGAGKLGAEVAGTSGVGNALAVPVRAAGIAPKLATALESGGMSLGGAPAKTVGEGVVNLLTRAAGGAATGGAAAGLVNPEDAGTGAVIGGVLPVATKVVGKAGNALGRAISGGDLAPEVRALADRAKQLGIDIPADRLVDSKPLNALASSLEYIPGSGRTATMDRMEGQLNRAVSRTFGQDSSNVTQALRKAGDDLGSKFDTVLQNNKVKVDQQFLTDLADASSTATKELGSDGARIIGNQVDEILAKANQTGEIDGQAAYNIKKTLDRIGKRNSPEAFYALDLKQKLMDALNRSLGPAEADSFKTVRQQYGNMLSLEKIAQNGAEGGISIGRLANMKNINNPELQELADISAQFLKSREGAHGAAQRVGAGALALGLTGPAGLGAGMATGRAANMLLNSGAMKNRLTTTATNRLVGEPDLAQFLYRAAPVLPADR